jgi:predicted amidohydrolase
MRRTVTIAVAQPLRRRPGRGEPRMTPAEHLAQSLDWVRRAPAGSDILCFPEYFSTASTEGEKTLPHAAIARHTPQFLDVLGKAAAKRRLHLVLCLPYRNRNVTFILDRRGRVVGQYAKAHLTIGERSRGVQEGMALPVFELDFGRIGVLVCYDLYFPEQARALALKGAEILFHPTRIMNEPSEKGFEALCLARAAENVCWFAASSFCPPPPFEYGSWQARSFVADLTGTILAEVGRVPGVTAATVDLAQREQRITGFAWSEFRRLRRPDLYGALTGHKR